VKASPPKPSISFDFQTTVSANIAEAFGNETVVNTTISNLTWYQDYSSGLDLFVFKTPVEGYTNYLLDFLQNSGISYNTTSCDWSCYQGKCCNKTAAAGDHNKNNIGGSANDSKNDGNSITKGIRFFDVVFESTESTRQRGEEADYYPPPPPPPPPPSCSCALVAVYRLIWTLYSNATYSGW